MTSHRSNRTTTLHVYVSDSSKKWAEKQAKKNNMSMSQYMDMVLQQLKNEDRN